MEREAQSSGIADFPKKYETWIFSLISIIGLAASLASLSRTAISGLFR